MNTRGFTLIELMVTVAMAAILLMVAVPNFTAFQRNSELTSAVNGLMAGINVARSEALKRGAFTLVVPLGGKDWKNGYQVFVDRNRDGKLDGGDVEVTQGSAVPDYIVITSNAEMLRFNGSGYSINALGGFNNATFSYARTDVTGAELVRQTRRLIVFAPGRVRICTPASAADINCSTASET